MSATIPPAAKPTPLTQFDRALAIIDDSKEHASPIAVAFFSALRDFVNGMNRVIPCSAAGTNLIVLTPNAAFPKIEKYVDYEIYAFTAEATSTGNVTMLVRLPNGDLATIKAFKTNGAAQATTGDIVANSVYLAVFADHLDGGAGGFVIK